LVKQFVERCTVPVTSLNADTIDENNPQWISKQWADVRQQMRLLKQEEHILIIDEIQKLKNWSEYVKREWDADTWNGLNLKVILLGSSRLLIKDGLTESLAGRYELIRMPHWSFAEMQEAFGFTLEEYIYFGGYPGSAKLIKNEARWKRYILQSIVDPAIEKDVLMTKRIHKPALLSQLFRIGSTYSAEIVAYNKLLGQLQDAGNTTTLANYLKVLGEAELLGGLQKFAHAPIRQVSSIPKFQVYNNALLSTYAGHGFMAEQLDSARWGRWVESAVGAHLMNWAEEYDYRVFYWRENNNEVDFVIQRGLEEVVAIEVKSGKRTDNQGVHVFADSFHPKYSIVVGGAGISLEQFLLLSPDKLF
jgi:predicted AAA+ superfamily ATPase